MTTHTIKAWHISPESAKADDLQDPNRLLFSNSDMRHFGWLCVGEADIVLRINVSEADLAISMCDTLREQIKKVQAETHLKVSLLEERIKALQTLTYEVKA